MAVDAQSISETDRDAGILALLPAVGQFARLHVEVHSLPRDREIADIVGLSGSDLFRRRGIMVKSEHDESN